MDNFGFIRVAAAVPQVRLGDVKANVGEICRIADKAADDGVSIAVFPELSVTGYTCGDLFGQNILIDEAQKGVRDIALHLKEKDITVVLGAPIRFRGRLYNCAVVLSGGEIKGIVPKIHMPSYNEFYESRWFGSGSDFLSGNECITIKYAGSECLISPNLLFEVGSAVIGIELCEDLWTPIPPSCHHCLAGAQIIFNLSASNEVLMKHAYRRDLVRQQSARTISAYIYCSAGIGESTQDLVYAGASLICENGALLAENERFLTDSSIITADVDIEKLDTLRQKMSTFASFAPDGTRSSQYSGLYTRVALGKVADTDFAAKLLRPIDPHPFVPMGNKMEMASRCNEILSIQIAGLASRLAHIGCKTAVIGISGGLDSTLALIVTALAFDRLGWERSRIIGITMPGYGTTKRTRTNAENLMAELGITSRKISITAACDRHFEDIGHDKSVHDTTYENSQARERTQILMDIANRTGGIVVGTGDLSELALGWATYNGDHMSMYAVNSSVPKTLVRHLVQWAAENRFNETAKSTLTDIVNTPISPELLPADENGNIKQITEDLVGPYELHDFFLYNFFRFGYSPKKILFLAKKAFCGESEGGTSYDEATIKKWLKTFIKRFFSQQFKRSCIPDGPKTGSVSLSPRGDLRMPSDAKSILWSDDID